MRDVARHSGVSIATVSHVLNQTRHVSAETTRRVMASVKELGYVPEYDLEKGVRETIAWYKNEGWL